MSAAPERPFGGYETAQDVVDAVSAGAIVRTEVIERALLALIGKDFAINFDSPAARALQEREHVQVRTESDRDDQRKRDGR
jgi:hypothetical protein